MGEGQNNSKIRNFLKQDVKWYGGPIQGNQKWPLDSVKNGYEFTPHILWDVLKVKIYLKV